MRKKIYNEVNAAKEKVISCWLENEPEYIKQWKLAIEKYSRNIIDIFPIKEVAEAKQFSSKNPISSYIVDLKLDSHPDGCSYARSIRKKNLVVPLFVVTSFFSEYASRVNKIANCHGIFQRLDLKGMTFKHFRTDFIDNTYKYWIYKKYKIDSVSREEFLAFKNKDFYFSLLRDLIINYIQRYLYENSYAWVIVGGNKIIESSRNMSDYPDFLEREELSKQAGCMIFAYTTLVISEEREIVVGNKYLPYYPKTMLEVDENKVIADVDTGTNRTLIPSNISEPDIDATPIKTEHLRKSYIYRDCKRTFSLSTINRLRKKTGPIELVVGIVDDWEKSPFKKINPDRGALVGRDIFAHKRIKLNIQTTSDQSGVETDIESIDKE
jgi:hypothetical protein